MVIEAAPDTIQPKDATTDNAYFVLGNVYDALTARDWSSGQPKIVPKLAESYSQQPDPRTWRFKLRPGIKFTNGEPVNADAVVAMVTNVGRAGRSRAGPSTSSASPGPAPPRSTISPSTSRPGRRTPSSRVER